MTDISIRLLKPMNIQILTFYLKLKHCKLQQLPQKYKYSLQITAEIMYKLLLSVSPVTQLEILHSWTGV